ncbi:MAG: ABC transporter substrate-binding protein [Candidatus Marinimicrobia bacterium]|nr:ABC transporter substrate-binding protein [Candidatus Neomarinimicrobiota bacterium]
MIKNRIMFFAVICVSFSLFQCAQKESLPTVGIVQLLENPQLDQGRFGVVDALKKAGFIDGKNIRIDFQNAQGDLPTIDMILRKFIAEKVKLIVTVSSPCLISACNQVKDIPVVYTIAYQPEILGIKSVPPKIVGVYDPLETDRIVQLMRKLIPGLRRVGIPWNPSEINARLAVESMKKTLARNQIDVVEIIINGSSEVYQAAEALASEKVEAMIACSDNSVYAGIGSLVKVGETNRIPIFVLEPTIVKDGACLGLGIDYYEWGLASGELAVWILKGESAENLSDIILEKKKLYLNLTHGKAQGLDFSPDLIKSADQAIP